MTARVFVGVAPRAGVGLTTLFINFAHIIGDTNRVLYVDLDILNLGGTGLLGLERECNIWEIINGRVNEETTFIHKFENFDVLPIYILKPKHMSIYLDGEERFINMILEKIDELKNSYDYVFIDTLPGYTVTSITTWQKYTSLIGAANYNVQAISSLLQVNDIFKEWSARNLKRGFSAIVFNDTGNQEKINIRVLQEIFTNIPIHTVPYTKEFYSSHPIANEDIIYKSELRRIIKNISQLAYG
ncbi:tyrosine kinase [archaeon]|nr:tyrosine kinase [archaeon]